jgi:hypothetical protein
MWVFWEQWAPYIEIIPGRRRYRGQLSGGNANDGAILRVEFVKPLILASPDSGDREGKARD